MYNLKRKPWRAVRRLRQSMNRRSGGMRLGLCALIFMEVTVLGVREPEVFCWLFGEAFHMDREVENLREVDLPDTEGNYPKEKTDSGITIDLKKGRIEFWKTDETIHPENGS